MTDRIYALTVVLDQPIRDDDIQPLMAAIRQLRGVIDVRPAVADMTLYAAQVRVRHELQQKLWRALLADDSGA